MKHVFRVATFSLLVATVILTGCQLSAPGSMAIYETTSVEIAILLPGIVSPMGLSAGNLTDIVSMTVAVAGKDINGEYQDPLATVDLTSDGDSVWSGTIPNLPVGPVLTFAVIAYDAADDEIYSGVTVQALTGVEDEVNVTLDPVEDVAAIIFPIISQITQAGEMVSVDVRGSANEQLNYTFLSGGGTFTPESGTVDLPSSGMGTFNSDYDALVGEYMHSVRVENSQGNTVTANFATKVFGTTSVAIEISFAPSIVGVSAQRIGDLVSWEAEVIDDRPDVELLYLWEFDGALAFADATQNPAELIGYDETRSGTITLTVTDNDGYSTIVSFTLVVGQFPDALVVSDIVGWGRNNHGQTDVPAGIDFTAIAAGGNHSVALKTDGSLVAWGQNSYGQTDVPAGTDFSAISAGPGYNMALKVDGSLVGWGYHIYGQIDVPAGTDFVAIATGSYHALALKTDGSLVGWGQNDYGQTNVPPGTDFVAIAAGHRHSLALKADGSLVGWGDNYWGEINVPAGKDFAAISARYSHNIALKADGSLVGWGSNQYGQINVPAGNDFWSIAAGAYHSLALRVDGSLVAWGLNSYGVIVVPAGTDFMAVAAGHQHNLALK